MNKLQEFAAIVEKQQIENLNVRDLSCEANIQNCRTRIILGRKYTKVDVGNSGKFMVDTGENIFGIKGYGVIHRGKRYGTLDTIGNYFWGDYSPIKIKKEV